MPTDEPPFDSAGWGGTGPRQPPAIEPPFISDEPMLGLATTEELFRELIARFTGTPSAYYANVDRVAKLAEMMGGLNAPEREYRTVDHA